MNQTFNKFFWLFKKQPTKDDTPVPFFAPPTRAFLKHRSLEGLGTLLIISSLVIGAAVLSYSSGDTSFNTSGRAIPKNILGAEGAFLSDILLQSIGFACFVPILTFFVWGIRCFNKTPPRKILFRIIGLLNASLFYSIALSALPVATSWPLMTSMGGVCGTFVLDFLVNTTI